jgi:retron-type reverse transcriptase
VRVHARCPVGAIGAGFAGFRWYYGPGVAGSGPDYFPLSALCPTNKLLPGNQPGIRRIILQHNQHIPFERYADDAICHCKSAEEARALWSALQERFAACKLVLHPEKTKIVYCKDANRLGDFPNHKTQLRPTLKRINLYGIRWARRKFKRLRRKTKGARDWFDRLRQVNPTLFAHWQLCHGNGRTSGAVRIERFTYGSGSARR